MQPWARNINNLNFLSLCLLACFPLLGMKVTVIAIIAFTFFSILSAIADRQEAKKILNWKLLLISITPFLLILIRTSLTDRSAEAMFYLEVSLSLIALPAAFFFYQLAEKPNRVNIPPLLFTASSLLIVIIGIVAAFSEILKHLGPDRFWKTTSQMLNDPSLPYHIRTLFENTVNLHPTYASVFIGISILITADLFIRRKRDSNFVEKACYLALILLMMITLAVLASRTPFIATMVALLFMLFMRVRKKVIFLYAFLSLSALTFLLAVTVPSFNARFREVSFNNAGVPSQNEENSFNLRTGIYKCSMEIIGEHWLMGVGPGNVQKKLNTCYNQIAPEVYKGTNYNTHNQFLDYWAGMGIAGPLSLLILLTYSFISNYRQQNFLAVAITLLFFISMFTENILTRQNGVVVFCFFTGLYFFSSVKKSANTTIGTKGH